MTEEIEKLLGGLILVLFLIVILATTIIFTLWDAKRNQQITKQENKFISKLNEKEKALILDYKQCKKIQRTKKGKEKQCKQK